MKHERVVRVLSGDTNIVEIIWIRKIKLAGTRSYRYNRTFKEIKWEPRRNMERPKILMQKRWLEKNIFNDILELDEKDFIGKINWKIDKSTKITLGMSFFLQKTLKTYYYYSVLE